MQILMHRGTFHCIQDFRHEYMKTITSPWVFMGFLPKKVNPPDSNIDKLMLHIAEVSESDAMTTYPVSRTLWSGSRTSVTLW
jgi:hypothetical protein